MRNVILLFIKYTNQFIKEFIMKRKSILSLNDFELDKAVIIAGTQYDRKRVLNDKIIAKMKKDFRKGMSPKDIAKKYGMKNVPHFNKK